MANNNDKTIHERVLTDKERMLEELNKTSGIVSSACKAAGISRMTFYRWYNEDPDFKEKVDDILNTDIEIPARLQAFMKGEKKCVPMSKDFADFKDFLMKQ